MLRRNFAARMTAVSTMWFIVVLLILLVAAYVGTALVAGRSLDDSLLQIAAAAQAGPLLDRDSPDAAAIMAEARSAGKAFRNWVEDREKADRREKDGKKPKKPKDGQAPLVLTTRPGWVDLVAPRQDLVRAAYVLLPDGNIRVVTAPAGRLARDLLAAGKRLGLLAALTVPVAAGLVYWTVSRTFAPLREMRDTVARIGPGSLDQRVAPASAPEDATVQGLVTVLNGMLDRIEKGYAAQARFTDDAAHELRTPLAAARARLEVALLRPRDAAAYPVILADVLGEVVRLSDLTEHLLLLSRAGHEVMTLARVEASALVSDAIRDLGPLAERGDVALVTEIPAGLAVTCDPVSVGRALANLVRNAIQHSPPGGTVTVTGAAADGGVAITVEDEGPGFAAGDVPSVFERFYRGRAPAGHQAGLGLGLALAAGIATAHGGSLAASNRLAGGARLRLWLPNRR